MSKVNIPNSDDVDALYGQLVAKASGHANYVRFMYPGKNNYVQVDTITSPAWISDSTFWYGADLDPDASSIRGRWFLQMSGVRRHIPRALVLYPTYQDGSNMYVNVFETFDSVDADVYWRTIDGWIQSRQIVVNIPPPQGPTTFNVKLALVDNDKDARPVHITVTAGTVSQTVTPTNPSDKENLNIIEFTLEGVPAGTNEIVIDLFSPSPNTFGAGPLGGDSAALVGMTANYVCEAIVP
jgi:hypothetical protein